ncbi:MAG: WG repeat-containing protein [Sulfurovaceae bacterium]|nr:WG repeat-containing protein [Sulfurovaceae bacterium]
MKKRTIFLLLFFMGCSSRNITKDKKIYSIYLDIINIESLDFKHNNLALKYINNKWYYINKDRKAMSVILDEKGKPDLFKEGLARTRVDGKIGFFDKNLNMILPPFYDYAFPFHNGIAEICVGCKDIQIDGHSMLDGGEWKRIDRTGLLIEE